MYIIYNIFIINNIFSFILLVKMVLLSYINYYNDFKTRGMHDDVCILEKITAGECQWGNISHLGFVYAENQDYDI